MARRLARGGHSVIHNRQPVILCRDRWIDWLDLGGDPTPLYEPGPLGTLRVELAPAEVGEPTR